MSISGWNMDDFFPEGTCMNFTECPITYLFFRSVGQAINYSPSVEFFLYFLVKEVFFVNITNKVISNFVAA
jgi:hypothetical protein